MRIDRVSSIATTPGRRSERANAGKSGSFSKTLGAGEGAPAVSSVSGGAALGPVDALLALQEVGDDPGGQSRGRRRGEALLDQLDELRLGLLGGTLSHAVIERLAAVVASKRDQADDPRLAQVLDEIELRAAVELAKLDR